MRPSGATIYKTIKNKTLYSLFFYLPTQKHPPNREFNARGMEPQPSAKREGSPLDAAVINALANRIYL
jgi:hypothetical protein